MTKKAKTNLPDWWNDITFEIVEKKTVTTDGYQFEVEVKMK